MVTTRRASPVLLPRGLCALAAMPTAAAAPPANRHPPNPRQPFSAHLSPTANRPPHANRPCNANCQPPPADRAPLRTRAEALAENCFVGLVCVLNRLPLFLVGKPGSSKTLAVQVRVTDRHASNGRGGGTLAAWAALAPAIVRALHGRALQRDRTFLTAPIATAARRRRPPPPPAAASTQVIAANLQGKTSPSPFFRAFPAVHVFAYQCSPLSTSDAILRQFEMAKRFQTHQAADSALTMLLLDEVGLAEHSPDMPLKVLHAMLVDPPIAVVGLSNWVRARGGARLRPPAPSCPS